MPNSLSQRLILPSWPQGAFAIRLIVAALGAYGVSELLGFNHGYSAVFSALIVTRPYQQGAWRAAGQRLLATALGIATAFVSVMVRKSGLNDYQLLALAIAPLSLLVAYDSSYRTAMISALLMLSAPFAKVPELDIAMARAAVVTMGAVVGIAVSLLVLPQPHHRIVATKALDILRLIVVQLRASLEPANPKASKGDDRLRKALLELGQMARDHKPKNADEDASNRLIGLTRHAQATSILLRGVWRASADRDVNARNNACEALSERLERLKNRPKGEVGADAAVDFRNLLGQIEDPQERWLIGMLARDLEGVSRLMT